MRFSKDAMAKAPAEAKPARLKSYVAPTGFVYQYYFAGEEHRAESRHYRFQVAVSHAAYVALEIHLPDPVLALWQRTNARELSLTECYAVAKMTLFRTLDSEQTGFRQPARITIDGGYLTEIATVLSFI